MINIHHNSTYIVIIFYLAKGVREGNGSTRSRDDLMTDFCNAGFYKRMVFLDRLRGN
jgi:hypothetical protein